VVAKHVQRSVTGFQHVLDHLLRRARAAEGVRSEVYEFLDVNRLIRYGDVPDLDSAITRSKLLSAHSGKPSSTSSM